MYLPSCPHNIDELHRFTLLGLHIVMRGVVRGHLVGRQNVIVVYNDGIISIVESKRMQAGQTRRYRLCSSTRKDHAGEHREKEIRIRQ
jgi:hypothetical protein